METGPQPPQPACSIRQPNCQLQREFGIDNAAYADHNRFETYVRLLGLNDNLLFTNKWSRNKY